MDIWVRQIIELREARGWSQAELARRMGFEKSVMNKIENGARKVSAEELGKFADIFSESADYLLGRTPDPHKVAAKELLDLQELLDSEQELAFHGEKLDTLEKQRINDLLTGFLWDQFKTKMQQKKF